jgi:hypothetical protein
MNFCAKQVKRSGRGFTNFEHYRLRVLLHAGGVTWPRPIYPPKDRVIGSPLIPEQPAIVLSGRSAARTCELQVASR